MYNSLKELPKEGQLCLCRCPGWTEIGYQVARFEEGIFQYPDQPNSQFNSLVIAWIPLSDEGEPVKFKSLPNNETATKDLLGDIISWEKDLSEYMSLEKKLNDRYLIFKRS